MDTLIGKLALVTGAANGIGQACACALAEQGADIIAVDIDGHGLEGLVGAIETLGRRAAAIVGDCREEAVVSKAFEHVGSQPVDILVNNVGQSAREKAGPFIDSSAETWAFVLDVSLMTAMRFSRRAAPGMAARGWGRIINMSSDAALIGDAGLADYAAAKSGLLGFTRSLARELAPRSVTVNAICPGAIRTRAHDRLSPAVLDQVKRGIPMGWVGEPEDIARMVTFLAGKGGRYITGQTFVIDGGRWMG